MFAWFWHGESHDPRNSFHLVRLFGVDQLIADAPCPWRERSQGFASLLCQSYDRNVENWLLNESVWLGRSVYDVTVVVSFAEGPFH